jgi:hypothetical protein
MIFYKYIDADPYIYRMSTQNYTHHTLDACGIKRVMDLGTCDDGSGKDTPVEQCGITQEDDWCH